ncbi:MAG: tetratricopeptide repeat protein, partial [Oceanospirillum sp.]|nr:tetratricopeptide repeat protein [Oceanospirillum sp.]
YETALEYCERARQLAEPRHDVGGFQVLWYIWADVLLSLGKYDEAWEAALKGQQACQQTGNQWMLAYLLIVMGNIALAQDNFDLAEQQFRSSYEIKDSMNDPEGMALAVNYLAQVALRQENYEQAQQLYQQSLTIYREIYDQGGLVRTLQGAGDTAVALKNWETAVAAYREALRIASDMQWEPLVLSLFVSVAQLFQKAGDEEQSAEIAAYVLHHSAAEQNAKNRATLLLKRMKHQPEPTETELPALTQHLLTELERRPFTPPPDKDSQHPIQQPLVDPLTPRELEVLHLIAEGLSNRAIAEKLVISVGTVKSYTSNIYSKLGVSSRTQAVAEAREIGLIQ